MTRMHMSFIPITCTAQAQHMQLRIALENMNIRPMKVEFMQEIYSAWLYLLDDVSGKLTSHLYDSVGIFLKTRYPI